MCMSGNLRRKLRNYSSRVWSFTIIRQFAFTELQRIAIKSESFRLQSFISWKTLAEIDVFTSFSSPSIFFLSSSKTTMTFQIVPLNDIPITRSRSVHSGFISSVLLEHSPLDSYSNARSLSVVTLFYIACWCVSLSSASFCKAVMLLSILLISTCISLYNGLYTLSQLRTCCMNSGRTAWK